MRLHDLLHDQRTAIIEDAVESIRRCHLRHYEAEGIDAARERLQGLYDLAVRTMASRNAAAIIAHAERIAEERFHSGFDLIEVQTAFNVLEEAIWNRVLRGLAPADFAEGLGLVSTVLGMGKDALARRYVTLATQVKAPSLDCRELFKGTA